MGPSIAAARRSALGRCAAGVSLEHRTCADADPWRLTTLGEAHFALGEPERATECLRDAVAVTARRTDPTEASVHVVLARVLLAWKGIAAREEAEASLTRALELTRRIGTRSIEPAVHVGLAELARHAGDDAARERELREAHRLFADIGAEGHAERLAGELAALTG